MNTKRVVSILSGLSVIAGQLGTAGQSINPGNHVAIRKEWLDYASEAMLESVEILTEEIFTTPSPDAQNKEAKCSNQGTS